ncbi:short-chain dehydrogenase [Pleomorphomonas diazotrophica]|uniref:Short-chain dehydrogenase n=1 Tax=Pleomorphomonas diazotrophica TaxID=1166257 RepID=A0A1I4Q455_9HYPH|nr:SDR family NAD(P)-dependent oxidoreductase [Pleomorphomonas diazotrophica]PKR90952.1 short-chain dehydrogenase [Pleomorphomonas diazotrophica]SFM34817.1 NAD(P)-dependent dehydrogenase, short-chain alcohol dehydrogenase family [Pleomorphomonas diazotrophica]
MSETQRIAIVTGASQGMGKETARQLLQKGLHVVITARSLAEAETAAKELGNGASAFELDVTREDQATSLAEWLLARFGRADVLVNNAGAFFEPTDQTAMMTTSVLSTPPEIYIKSFTTNALGAFIVSKAIVPVMRQNGYGRIVNVSSSMGSLTTMTRGWPAYRTSKAALNACTRLFADELKDENIKVNSVNPGWVRTSMGGAQAALSVEDGVRPAVWAATLPDDGPSGGFFEAGGPCPW